jgi:hypothetical protein
MQDGMISYDEAVRICYAGISLDGLEHMGLATIDSRGHFCRAYPKTKTVRTHSGKVYDMPVDLEKVSYLKVVNSKKWFLAKIKYGI